MAGRLEVVGGAGGLEVLAVRLSGVAVPDPVSPGGVEDLVAAGGIGGISERVGEVTTGTLKDGSEGAVGADELRVVVVVIRLDGGGVTAACDTSNWKPGSVNGAPI